MQVIENLRDIVYEPVNEEYGWGKYGDFRVLIRRRDGYVNATKLCKEGKKELSHWKDNSGSKETIEELESSLGIPGDDLMQLVIGGKNTEIRGTYVHQDLVPHIAMWISPAFSVRVSRIINNYIVREYRETIRQRDEQIDELSQGMRRIETKLQEAHGDRLRLEDNLKLAREDGLRLEDSLKLAHEDRQQLKQKLDLANENLIAACQGISEANGSIRGMRHTLFQTARKHVPLEDLSAGKLETYALFHLGEHKNGGELYKQCCARPAHLENRRKELQDKYETCREIVTIAPVPNAQALASLFESKLKERGAFVKGKSIILDETKLTEDEIVEMAHETFDERIDPAREAAEENSPVQVELEEGKISIQKLQVQPEAPQPQPNEPEEKAAAPDHFSDLMTLRLEQLKDIARALPKNRTLGGWSKNTNKISLVNWIVAARCFISPINPPRRSLT